MGMLQVFSVNIFVLLDPVDTLYFVTPLLARKIDVFPDIFIKPFLYVPQWVTLLLQKESIRNVL